MKKHNKYSYFTASHCPFILPSHSKIYILYLEAPILIRLPSGERVVDSAVCSFTFWKTGTIQSPIMQHIHFKFDSFRMIWMADGLENVCVWLVSYCNVHNES